MMRLKWAVSIFEGRSAAIYCRQTRKLWMSIPRTGKARIGVFWFKNIIMLRFSRWLTLRIPARLELSHFAASASFFPLRVNIKVIALPIVTGPIEPSIAMCNLLHLRHILSKSMCTSSAPISCSRQ